MRVMYVVIARRDRRGIPEYVVMDDDGGIEVGMFDCQRWAETFADELNGRYRYDNIDTFDYSDWILPNVIGVAQPRTIRR